MADNFKFFGHQPLDLSGVQNIYSATSQPLHGMAEARRRQKILQDIQRMKRTQAILRASGVQVSDWTSGLRSIANQTKPGLTRAQAESQGQEKFLGDTIRRYKPKDDNQLRNLLNAIGLGAEWFSKAKTMASVYNLGPEETLYGREDGDIRTYTGQKNDPRMLALKKQGGVYPNKDVFNEVEAEEKEKMRFAAAQEASQQTFATWDEVKAWLKKRQEDTAAGQSDVNWFDPDISNDFLVRYEKLMKKGDQYTYWFMRPREGKSPVLDAKTLERGSDAEATFKAQYPNGSLSKEAALVAGGVSTKQNELIQKGLALEGTVQDKIKHIFEQAENIYIQDLPAFRNKVVETAYKPLSAQFDYKIKQVQHDEALKKALSVAEIDKVMPAIRTALDKAGSVVVPTVRLGPNQGNVRVQADDIWIKQIVDSAVSSLSGVTGITEETRAHVKKYLEDTLKNRREATKFGAEMEAHVAGLSSEKLLQQKRMLEIEQLTFKNMTYANATKVNAVINAAFDLYENGQLPEGQSLRTYIESELGLSNITIHDPAIWEKIRSEVSSFENDIEQDKVTQLTIASQQQALDKGERDIEKQMFEVTTGYGAVTPGYRYNSNAEEYKGADGASVYVITLEQEKAAAAAGYTRAAPRAYQDIDSKYVKYNGGITKLGGPANRHEQEAYPGMIGETVLSRIGKREEVKGLQRDLQNQHGKAISGVQNTQTRFEAVKAALESGKALGDYAAVINFMRTMDDSIVTQAEIDTLQSHASFIEQMRQMRASWVEGTKLTPGQRGMIAYLMEEALRGLQSTKLADIKDTVDGWANLYRPEIEPLNPIFSGDIAPWLARWMDNEGQSIDIPNKPKGAKTHNISEQLEGNVKLLRSKMEWSPSVVKDESGQIVGGNLKESGATNLPKPVPTSPTKSWSLGAIAPEDRLKTIKDWIRVYSKHYPPDHFIINELKQALKDLGG